MSVYQGINPKTLRPMFKYAVPVGKLSKYPAKHMTVIQSPSLCLWVRTRRGIKVAQGTWLDQGAGITYLLST